jgi:hypothetical protein
MNSVVESLIITAIGAACATLCTLGLRSDWYIQQTAESVLRSNRRPVTPDAIAQMAPYLKTALIIGIVMGVAITVIGVITLVIGVTKVLNGL